MDFQVLNDRDRNEISAVETPTTTTSLQISFPEVKIKHLF